MNKVRNTIEGKGKNILNIYFTAGYPELNSICDIVTSLEKAGANLIELGIPYSDPLADGMTIQKSSAVALKNGMNLKSLFEQIEETSKVSSIPLILMGYYNQILQYGAEAFFRKAAQVGISGFIIPDLPMYEYDKKYKSLFEELSLGMSFLISPMTSDERIREADRLSSGFIYIVSQSSITGKVQDISKIQEAYFDRIANMNLSSPKLIGFGIHDKTTFDRASRYSNGAIVGSAFIRHLADKGSNEVEMKKFVSSLIG